MEGINMREIWIFKYVIWDNNTDSELMSELQTCFSKDEAMNMLETKYAENASELEIIEGHFSAERAWQSIEGYQLQYSIERLV
jgi:hypothetical protein